MAACKTDIPWTERKSRSRGILDLISGSYPMFTCGFPVGDYLPVFHFHDVTGEYLERYLSYLKDNNYRTVQSAELGRIARGEASPKHRHVALCFDDAWSSMQETVAPLMEAYDFTAITYAIPGRKDASLLRGDSLKTLASTGRIDVQSHTLTHSMINCSDSVVGFVTPHYGAPLLSRPALAGDRVTMEQHLTPDMLGYPLYQTRSRMSDARRYIEPAEAAQACMEYVGSHGGASYFEKKDWQQPLRDIMADAAGHWETEMEQEQAIQHELTASREMLEDTLGAGVDHICMPWAVCGHRAQALLPAAGYRSCVSDRLFGFRAVRRNTDPMRLMRLRHEWVFALPGKGRRFMWTRAV